LTSFKHETEVFSKTLTFFPKAPTWANYQYIFQRGAAYLKYFSNSIIITGAGVVITTVLSAAAGYAFAKLPFKGREFILVSILFVITFPFAVLLIPIYIMSFELNLLNTKIGLILPNVAALLPFTIFIMRSVFKSIPSDLEDAAEIDGCSVFMTWLKVMLPLARNGIVTVIIYSFYIIWGEYIFAVTLATREASMPLSVALTLLRGESWNYGVLGAAITLAVVPPIAIFLIFQKHLISGIVGGAVKG
jgi:ABC-type glycerol-3-phosphate transport system permease component